MQAAADKDLKPLESDLRFIASILQGLESDFERIDSIAQSVNHALR